VEVFLRLIERILVQMI